MQGMEERYKKYIEKAKSVIKTLDPKQNPNAAPEMSALRNQLGEKDRLIETLEQVIFFIDLLCSNIHRFSTKRIITEHISIF